MNDIIYTSISLLFSHWVLVSCTGFSPLSARFSSLSSCSYSISLFLELVVIVCRNICLYDFVFDSTIYKDAVLLFLFYFFTYFLFCQILKSCIWHFSLITIVLLLSHLSFSILNSERSIGDNSGSFAYPKNAFDGSRKDMNAAIDRICEFTGKSLHDQHHFIKFNLNLCPLKWEDIYFFCILLEYFQFRIHVTENFLYNWFDTKPHIHSTHPNHPTLCSLILLQDVATSNHPLIITKGA